jgi:transposase
MKAEYGDSCLSQGRVYEWVERFKNGRQNVSDEHRSGRPVSVATETDLAANLWLQAVTVDETVMNMSHGSAYDIDHDNLGYRRVRSRWVPRQLTDDHRRERQTICQERLDRHAREGDTSLHRIVTRDESWVYHYEPESKRQSMQWKRSSSPANKNLRHRLQLGKSCWPSFRMSMVRYWCAFRKRVKLWLKLDTVTC